MYVSISLWPIINMLKILVTCEKMHMVLVVVLDGLSQHSYPNPAFQARAGFRHLCWDKPISHSNQYHMHIITGAGRVFAWWRRGATEITARYSGTTGATGCDVPSAMIAGMQHVPGESVTRARVRAKRSDIYSIFRHTVMQSYADWKHMPK